MYNYYGISRCGGMADAPDSKSGEFSRVGSSPTNGISIIFTIKTIKSFKILKKVLTFFVLYIIIIFVVKLAVVAELAYALD